MELKEIKCKNCGAKLEIDSKETSVKCEYCKTTFSVDDEYTKSYKATKGALDAEKDSVPKESKIIFYAILGVFAFIFVGTIVFIGSMLINGSLLFGNLISRDIESNSNNSIVTDVYKGFSNYTFEMYNGTKYGTRVSDLIDDVNVSNKKNNHQVVIIFNNIEYKENDELISLKNEIGDWDKYEVTVNYNEDKKVDRINIVKEN